MNTKTLEILEFDKVLTYLSAHALSKLGAQRCLDANVFEDVNTIKNELTLTTQARTIINNAINVPLENIYDIEKSLEDAKKKLRLNEQEIIDIAHLVSEINPIKHYWDIGIHARKGIEF